MTQGFASALAWPGGLAPDCRHLVPTVTVIQRIGNVSWMEPAALPLSRISASGNPSVTAWHDHRLVGIRAALRSTASTDVVRTSDTAAASIAGA